MELADESFDFEMFSGGMHALGGNGFQGLVGTVTYEGVWVWCGKRKLLK